jgi:hypothetical protein
MITLDNNVYEKIGETVGVPRIVSSSNPFVAG